MNRQAVVFGAGGHGAVVADVLIAAGRAPLGFLDDLHEVSDEHVPVPVLGSLRWLHDNEPSNFVAALGVGDNAARRTVAERLSRAGVEVITAIHPTATISGSARIEVGAVVMAGAVINPRAVIRMGAIVNTGAVVEHDCELGDFCHLSPGAVLGGGARVGAGAHVGLGAVVLPLISVGKDAIVGGGAVVTRNVPASMVAYGVPAVVRRKVHDRD